MRANLEDNQARRMRQQSTLYGSVRQTLTGTYVIKDDGPTFHFLDPGGVDRTVQLPTLKNTGGQQYFIVNLSLTNQLNVVDALGASIGPIGANSTKIAISSNKEWSFVGALGPAGAAGPGYSTTSAQNKTTAGSGSVSFSDVGSGLAWLAGARARATSRGTGEFMEGVVTSYSGNTLVVTMDLNSGTAAHSDWNINLAGQQGTAGSGSVSGGTINGVAISGGPTSITGAVVLGGAEILVGQTAAAPLNKAVGGDLGMNNLGAFTIAALAVTTGKINDLAVTTAKIAASAVTYAKIQDISATARVLGRKTAAAGVTEELSSADLVTLLGGNIAVVQAPGTWKLFYSDGSSVIQPLALGAVSTAMVSTGAAAAPTAQVVLQPNVTQLLTAGFNTTSTNTNKHGAAQSFVPTADSTHTNIQSLALNDDNSGLTGTFTFDIPTTDCSIAIAVTNTNTVAATLSTSNYTKQTGDTYVGTTGLKYIFSVLRVGAVKHLHITALQ